MQCTVITLHSNHLATDDTSFWRSEKTHHRPISHEPGRKETAYAWYSQSPLTCATERWLKSILPSTGQKRHGKKATRREAREQGSLRHRQSDWSWAAAIHTRLMNHTVGCFHLRPGCSDPLPCFCLCTHIIPPNHKQKTYNQQQHPHLHYNILQSC